MFLWPFQHEPAVVGSSSAGALGNGEHSDRAGCPICSPRYPNLRPARSRPVPMGLCAVSHWCEGCRDKGKARLSSALDRISERITLGFQTLSRPEAIRGSTIEKHKFTLYFNMIWRRECQSIPIER